MNDDERKCVRHSIAVLGSGALTSHLYRDTDSVETNYRFCVSRMNDDLEPTQSLRTRDLFSLVKLCQILAFSMADDGWLPSELRLQVLVLAEQLDEVTRTFGAESP